MAVVNEFMKWYLQKFFSGGLSSQGLFGRTSNHAVSSDWMDTTPFTSPWVSEMMQQMFKSTGNPTGNTTDDGAFNKHWINEVMRQSMQGSPFVQGTSQQHTPWPLGQQDPDLNWIFGGNHTASAGHNSVRNRPRGRRK